MRTRILLLLASVACAASLVAGCGGGIPGDSVATVGEENITKSKYDHWLTIAAKSGGQPDGSIPKPPDYKDCIANKRKTLPEPAKGQPKTTDEQLKTQCESEYKSLQQQVMQLLISFEWIEGEAASQGIKVTDAEVKKQFESQKKASFPKEEDYTKFLEQSGQTEEDILMRVRLDLLSNKLREKVTKDAGKVTDAEITKYYNENKTRFAQPERRDLLVVLTKTEAKAQQAKAALEGGQGFPAVAKRFSIDPQSKAQGGKLPAVAKGQQEQAFDEAIFKAKKGALTGPVKTQFGFYVFRVTKVTPASQQSQEQASATIRQLLVSQKQQKALDAFVKRFTKEWRAKTDCKKAYATTDCSNGPKPTPTPTVGAPGSAPTAAPSQ
jgi:foldase protein PrsA